MKALKLPAHPSMATNYLWMDGISQKKYGPLSRERFKVDVAIVGGGIAGITAAYLLKNAGRSVAVIERDRVGHGETGHTTAHLTQILDQRFFTLKKKFGEDGAKLAAESSQFAIGFIEDLAQSLGVECEFSRVPGYLYAEKKKDLKELENEYTMMQKIGIDVASESSAPLPFDTVGAVRVENQGQFHPLRYVGGIAETIPDGESVIFEQTQVLQIEDGNPCRVTTEHGIILASQVISAADSPSSSAYLLQTKVYPYRTYAIGATPHNFLSLHGLFYDMADPYHYIRMHDDLLIIGGEDHRVGMKKDTEQSFRALIRYSEARFDLESIPYRWSGQVMEPADGLPYIGKSPFARNVYVATGFSGTGMTFGTLSGVILADTLLGKKNLWADLYSSTRLKPVASARRYIAENVDFPKCLVKDWATPAEAKSPDEIAPGEGKLIRQGATKAAVYRDDKGGLHSVSAVCPHLGCMVGFNRAEKSWDCPCHGSRFSTDGQLLHGPAMKDLEKVVLSGERDVTSDEPEKDEDKRVA